MNRTKEKQQPVSKTGKVTVPKKAVSKGTVMLKESANRAVATNRKTITSWLLRSALDGDLKSANLLVSLAEGAAAASRDKEVQVLKQSIASAWAAEPQWTGELSESAAEIDAGSREPES